MRSVESNLFDLHSWYSDQLFYMQRVGFDAFAVRADKNIHDAVKGLTDFSEKYQTSWDEKNPLFRRVKRETVQTAD